MRILLVQVPTSQLGSGEKVYPLGLARLAALVPSHLEKSALDMNLCTDPWLSLGARVQDVRPDLVAFSFRNMDPLAGHQRSYFSALKTASQLTRNLAPGAGILAGGPAFTLFADRLMQEIPEIDFGFAGEAEPVFQEILSRFPDIRGVPGVIFRKDGKVLRCPAGPPLAMADLPEPDTDCFPPADYLLGNAYVAAMGIEGKRGCDLRCSYCVYPCLGGGRIRLRDPVQVVNEMEKLNREHGVRLFHFTDPVVNRPADHFESLCRELKSRALDISWTGFFREDAFTKPQAFLAREAGLVACYFSGDALTDQGLKTLNKKLTPEDLIRAAKITTEAGLLTMCHFLVNLPFETGAHAAEARETIDRLLEIHAPAGNLGAVIFNTVRVYPGAPLTGRLVDSGLLDPNTDLLYPVYYNPLETAPVLHELEARCHAAGVLSRLNLQRGKPERGER